MRPSGARARSDNADSGVLMPFSTDAAVLVEDVHKSFKNVHALRGINFTAPRGTVLGSSPPWTIHSPAGRTSNCSAG